jgi:hypothetical protein
MENKITEEIIKANGNASKLIKNLKDSENEKNN